MPAPKGNDYGARRTGPASTVRTESTDGAGYARVQMQVTTDEKRAWVRQAKREGLSLRAWLAVAADERIKKFKHGG